MAANLAEARSHNVPPEVFLRHWREIREAKNAHADTSTAVARAKKSAKSAGVDLDALKLLEKFADLDTDEAEVQLRHLFTYAKWIKLPLGTQTEMFQAPEPKPDVAQEHADWEAGEAGIAAGKSGLKRTVNPYKAGTSTHVAWDRAWLGGKEWLKEQAKLAGDLGRNHKNGNGDAPAASEPDVEADPKPAAAASGRGRRKKANGAASALL
jgi:hypothetical protein